MQYISPLHFLELSAAGSTIDKKDLLLAKKKLLAELELNDGKGVEINGKELFTNDIVRFFDDLQQAPDLSRHLAIYRDPILLRFLEHNLLERKDRIASNPLYGDEAFINWISPYYAHSFMAFADECLLYSMDDSWTTLLGNPFLMNNYDQEAVWHNIEHSIQVNIGQLEFAEENSVSKETMNDLATVCSFRYVQMLKQLPRERFGLVCDQLAFVMMQLCIKIFNHVEREWPLIILDNAYILAASEETKTQVADKKAEMENIVARSATRRGNATNWWTYVRVALFIIFIISRTSGDCNRSSNNNNYNSNTPSGPVYIHNSSGDSILLQTLEERMQQIQDRKRRKQLTDSEEQEALQNIMRQEKH